MTAKEELVSVLEAFMDKWYDMDIAPALSIRARAAIKRAKEPECCHDLDGCQQNVKAEARL